MSHKWNPDKPFNNIPLLPPETELETKNVLKSCLDARVALAELKQAAEQIPNQSILINTLPMLEAQSSSEIEHIVTTTDNLFRYMELERGADPATREALSYRKALLDAFNSLSNHPLNTRTAEKICSKIKSVDMSIRKVTGTAIGNMATGEIIYTPPEGESHIRDLLANWERFMHNQTEIDPLIRMAVGHYQFEAIHPFTDGNGRTGRVLNSLFLVQEELLTLPILYLSRYIIENRSDYYRLLRAVTTGSSWEEWIVYILQGVESTSKWTVNKISAITGLARKTREYVRAESPSIYSHELIDIIFEQPYCRIRNLEQAGIAKRQTGAKYLQELASIGVLEERKIGRENIYINVKLMKLLTEDR